MYDFVTILACAGCAIFFYALLWVTNKLGLEDTYVQGILGWGVLLCLVPIAWNILHLIVNFLSSRALRI